MRSLIRRYALNATLILAGVAIALLVYRASEQGTATVQNCQLARGLAHIESEFIRTDAIDRKGALTAQERTQDIKAFGRIIAANSLQRQVREQQALDNRTINYWRYTLVPEARHLASVADCSAK